MKAKYRPTEQRFGTAVLRDARDFAALGGKRAELYEQCPSATPFQSRGRVRLSWVLYAGYQVLRSWAERYAYAEGAPGWVKRRTMARILRRRIRAKSVEGGHHNG